VTSRAFTDRLRRRARRAGIVLSAESARKIETYFDLLGRWNQKINLTALDDPEEAVDRLLIEPLIASKHLPAADAAVLDIGSGGGSPAIPLKIMAPGIRLWMVESKTRKAAFLREAVRQLQLDRTEVETARFEELLTRPDLHESMDLVTLRAVRVEPKTLLGLQAFLRPGGQLFWFRGPGGADVPFALHPPLAFVAAHPLVDSLGSRLVLLRKVK
jgi:16S rRNA (guanine527-N7)-methyltransferase